MIFPGFASAKGIENLFTKKEIESLQDYVIVGVEPINRLDRQSLCAQCNKAKIITMSQAEMEKTLPFFNANGSFSYFILEWEDGNTIKTTKKDPRYSLSIGGHLHGSKNQVYDGKNYKVEIDSDLYMPFYRAENPDYEKLVTCDQGYMQIFLDKNEKMLGYSYGRTVVWLEKMKIETYKFMSNLLFSRDKKIKRNDLKNFKIGTDIETMIIDSDGTVHEATEFIVDSRETVIGTDGFVKTLELRPEPSKTWMGLLENTEEALSSVNQILPQGYDLCSGGGREIGHSIGVHIHVSGLPTDQGGVKPDELVLIFDNMIYSPIMVNCPGYRRANMGEYGKFGDYRSREKPGGDGKFPHEGFEWRGLPNVCTTRELFASILAISEGIAKTWASGKDIEFTYPETERLTVESYSSLVNFDKIQDEIAYFVRFVNGFENLYRKILKTWFNKIGDKIEGQDLRIYHVKVTKDDVPLIMHHDRMIADKCFIHSCNGNNYLISHNKLGKSELTKLTGRLNKFVVADLGRNLKHTEWQDNFIVPVLGEEGRDLKNCLYLGIPVEVLRNLPEPRYSRNFVKIFIQSIIKNI